MENDFIQDILPNVNNDINYERKFWVRFAIKQLINCNSFNMY